MVGSKENCKFGLGVKGLNNSIKKVRLKTRQQSLQLCLRKAGSQRKSNHCMVKENLKHLFKAAITFQPQTHQQTTKSMILAFNFLSVSPKIFLSHGRVALLKVLVTTGSKEKAREDEGQALLLGVLVSGKTKQRSSIGVFILESPLSESAQQL